MVPYTVQDTTTEENDRSCAPPEMKSPSSPDSTALLARRIKTENINDKSHAISKNLDKSSVSKANITDTVPKINEESLIQSRSLFSNLGKKNVALSVGKF